MQTLAATARALSKLFSDPVLTVACVLLIVVSIGWLVTTRLIVRGLKRAARRGRPVPRIDVVRPPRDIWSYPPETPGNDSSFPHSDVIPKTRVVVDQAATELPSRTGTRWSLGAPMLNRKGLDQSEARGRDAPLTRRSLKRKGPGKTQGPYSM